MRLSLFRIGLLLAAAIHCVPLLGLFGDRGFAALYGLTVNDAATELLLRHRAVLFGLLAGVLVLAVLRPALRGLAIVGGLISTVSFMLLAGDPGQLNAALQRVWWGDAVAVGGLLLAALAQRGMPRERA